jgi:hypothetical protein
MNAYSAVTDEEEKPLSDFEKAMKKLVNIERIDEPAEQEYKLTMMKKEEEKKTKQGKSKALPPVATGLVGSNATLEHIKQVKPVRITILHWVVCCMFPCIHLFVVCLFDCLFSLEHIQDRGRCYESASSAVPSRCCQSWRSSCAWPRTAANSKGFWCWLWCSAPELPGKRMVEFIH